MALSRVNTSAKDQLSASLQSTHIEKQTDGRVITVLQSVAVK